MISVLSVGILSIEKEEIERSEKKKYAHCVKELEEEKKKYSGWCICLLNGYFR